MSRFVVVTDGSTALRVRTGAGTNFPQASAITALAVGTEINSLETRQVAHEQWLRIGTNRWVNASQSFGTVRNCLAIQSGWSIQTGNNISSNRVRVVNAPQGLNFRSAPIALNNINIVGTLNNNTNHNWPGGQVAVDPRQPANSSTRIWLRLGNRRWISAAHVAAPA